MISISYTTCSCDVAELGPEDVFVYANLLFVGLRLKLHQGWISEALTIGTYVEH